MANPTNKSDDAWPITWQAVEDAQLRDWLRLTPAQRLELAEDLLEFVRFAKQNVAPTTGNKT